MLFELISGSSAGLSTNSLVVLRFMIIRLLEAQQCKYSRETRRSCTLIFIWKYLHHGLPLKWNWFVVLLHLYFFHFLSLSLSSLLFTSPFILHIKTLSPFLLLLHWFTLYSYLALFSVVFCVLDFVVNCFIKEHENTQKCTHARAFAHTHTWLSAPQSSLDLCLERSSCINVAGIKSW